MLGIVFASEYLRKVKTRTFVVVTVLVPLVIFGIFGISATLTMSSFDSGDSGGDETRQRALDIAVLDPTGTILAALQQANRGAYQFTAATANEEVAKQTVLNGGHDGLLTIPTDLDDGFDFYVRQRGSKVEQWWTLHNFVLGIVRETRLSQYELSPQLRAVLASKPPFDIVRLTDEGEGRSAADMVMGQVLSAIAALLLTCFVMLYGGNVMQAVMEEKASRMAEIVISAVRPFDMLLGKILAAAAVGVTQVAAWIALFALLFLVLVPVLAPAFTFASLGEPPEGVVSAQLADAGLHSVTDALAYLPDLGFAISPAPIIVALLLLPFGFLIYASVFASLGALYENVADAQNTTFMAAMLPMIVSLFTVMEITTSPDSALVVFGTFFPFSAHAVLPARMLIADVPGWHVAVGIAMSVAGSLAMVWLSGRILRGSLLSYGKTPQLRDLRRILFGD